MSVVVALGGNAIARPGRTDAEAQREAIRGAARAIGRLCDRENVVITHGNGPQVGLLAMQAATAGRSLPLDVLSAETEGMLGYWIEQELRAELPGRDVVALLTQVEVREDDPAFATPTKPIGPELDAQTAERLASELGWRYGGSGRGRRRLVASPLPGRVLEIAVIQLLVRHGVIVVCAGGGGVPVVQDREGRFHGVEAVIDKDEASALLATELGADRLLLLTDVPAVYRDWPTAREPIRSASPSALDDLELEEGSMAPKVRAACRFVRQTGGTAHIGSLESASDLLGGRAGTTVVPGQEPIG